jgi:mono/diheme cytochrome c family protein
LNEEKRMEEFELAQRARAIETGASLFDQQCSRCHGTQGTGIPGLCPPLNDRYFFDQRMKDIGWSGTLEDYIVATASSGRLISTRPESYPGQGVPAMPSFLDRYGGPLREDQIRYIAAFIMNWQESAPDRGTPEPMAGPSVGTDINVELPEGDAASGEALATSKGCVGCHVSANVGPAWASAGGIPGIGDRAAARFTEAGYAGQATSPEQYLLESIVAPNTYVVSGYAENLMPGNYGSTLTAQETADLIAYMLTIK